MNTSYCMSAGYLQQSCCNICYKNYNQSFCESAYDPRHENQRVRCENDLDDYKETDAPVGICEVNATKIDLPPLMWSGYENCPKSLIMRNTGRTVMINGQWGYGKPCLTGGPLNGTYIFSQIHFHCPSEHHINGIRYPLEMHVVHYKTSYLTQEKAMYERDGTLVLVYLFQVIDHGATQLGHLSKAVTCLDSQNVSIELPKVSLNHLITPFASNYYFYWGSVKTEKNSYLLQWFVHRKIACVTRGEVNNIFKVMDTLKSPVGFTRMKPENGEVFYVEEDESFCQEKTCSTQSGAEKLKTHTCKSQTSCRSSCSLRKSNSCSQKCDLKEETKHTTTKQVKISFADGCTNTTPVSSQCDIKKSKTVTKKTEKGSGCDVKSVKESKQTKKVGAACKEEKTKAKKEAKAKEKKAKKDIKACEKIAKMVCKSSSSCKSLAKSNNEEVKKKEKAMTEALCDAMDDIKTLYEKKHSAKKKPEVGESSKSQKDNDEVQVNFLLTPNNVLSTYSNAVNSVDSKSSVVKEKGGTREEYSKSCFNIPTQILIKRQSISDTQLPTTNSQNESKEFCLMMEHFFRTDSSKKDDKCKDQSWNFQEYHVAIEYDHNVLQEYNGMLEPDKLSLGNYEKLNLVPKYENPKDLHIALTDCSIKLENSDDIRIRAKFLVKENVLTNSFFNEKRAPVISNVLDVGTQYAVQEMDSMNPFKQESLLSSTSEVEEYIRNEVTKLITGGSSSLNKSDLREELKEDLYQKLYLELRDKLEQELRQEFRHRDNCNSSLGEEELDIDSSSRKTVLSSEKQNEKVFHIPVEPIKRSDSILSTERKNETEVEIIEVKKSNTNVDRWNESKLKEMVKSIVPVRIERTNRRNCLRISRKHASKISDGNSDRLSCGGSSSNSSSCSKGSRKTTYFVYDRIEKDSNTGKKIFVGSFKTKEEIRNLRHCNSSQEKYSPDVFSRENSDALQKNSKSVEVQDLFSKDSDIFNIETWCNKQLSQASYGDPTGTSAKSQSDPDQNQIDEYLQKNSVKNQSMVEGKRSFAGEVVGQASDKPESQSSKEPEGGVAAENVKDELDRDQMDKSSMDVDISTMRSFLTVGSDRTNHPKISKPTRRNVNKSVTNISSKSTSTELEEFVRKENLGDIKIKGRPQSATSKSRISSKSGKSKGTVVVIPIEVESLSKIELILVERTDNNMNTSTDKEYIPCLNCYKCSELSSTVNFNSNFPAYRFTCFVKVTVLEANVSNHDSSYYTFSLISFLSFN